MDNSIVTLKCIRYGNDLVISDGSYISMIPIHAVVQNKCIQTGVLELDCTQRIATIRPKTGFFKGIDRDWLGYKLDNRSTIEYIIDCVKRFKNMDINNWIIGM